MRRQLMDRELDDRDTPDMNLTSRKPRRGVIVSRVARLQSDPTDRSSRCSSLLRTFGFLVQKALLMRGLPVRPEHLLSKAQERIYDAKRALRPTIFA